jgi:hypothetical protein
MERWGACQKRGLAVSKETSPVRQGDASHSLKEGKLMVEVTEEANKCRRVIETRDRRKAKPMRVKRKGKKGGVK